VNSKFRALYHACLAEIVGEDAHDESVSSNHLQQPVPTITPSQPPPRVTTQKPLIHEIPTPAVAPPYLRAEVRRDDFDQPQVVPVIAPQGPAITPQQPTKTVQVTTTEKNWRLKFAAHDAERVRQFLHSYRTNDLNAFHGFRGYPTAVDAALDIIQRACAQFEIVEGDVICTRRCPARLAVIALNHTDRFDFACRFGRLLGTPFVEIDGGRVESSDDFVALCVAGWKANSRVRDYGIEEWPMVESAQGRLRLTAPPMSVFVENFPTAKIIRKQLFAAFAGDGLLAGKIASGRIEYDLSGVCVILGVESVKSIPTAYRPALIPVTVLGRA
jgi:hypothetical protein